MANIANLFVGEINTEVVNTWVSNAAERVVDCFDECVESGDDPSDVDIYGLVTACAEDYVADAHSALTIIAAYGWGNAVTCACDYEDGPLALFETDIYCAAAEVVNERYDVTL